MKIYVKIMYKRLLKFMSNKKLISKNQIGFKEKGRTTDHIFTLKTITDQYKQNNKIFFAAFIDLRKAFDTVWRMGLFYKLLKNKAPAKLFNIIYPMYSETKCRMKFSSSSRKRGKARGCIVLNLFYLTILLMMW